MSIVINNKFTFFGALLIFAAGFFFLFKNMNHNVFIIAFLISFFTFLMGSEAICLFGWKENKYLFSQKIDTHAYTAIVISLMFLFLSYIITYAYLRKRYPIVRGKEALSMRLITIRKVSLFVFYFLVIFKIIVNLSEVLFVRSFGYSNLYSDYYFQGPGFFIKLADMCTTSFYVFLGTLPTKKECKFPVILYIGINLITIFSGRRNDLIVTMLLIFIYYCMRNIMHSGNEVWVSRKCLLVLIILSPLALSILSAISSIRAGIQDNIVVSYFTGIKDFFYQQGFSINIIKWEKLLEESIPDKIYSLGQTYEFFTNGNIVSRLLFDFQTYSGQTVERALEGHRMSYLLSYLVFPWSYVNGYGVGSCYIAEAYHDFGYLGVAIFNSIYGFLFAKFNYIKYRGPFFMAIAFLMMQSLLMAPRAYADGFIGSVLDFSNIEILLVIWLASKYFFKRSSLIKPVIKDVNQ